MDGLSDEMSFFIFLLERYAFAKKTTADKVLRKWDKLKISTTIFDMYELYHCEALENAFADIEKLEKMAYIQQN